jgi:hypothetical protein
VLVAQVLPHQLLVHLSPMLAVAVAATNQMLDIA